MAEDIVPGLLTALQDNFKARFNTSDIIKRMYKKIRDGTATYDEANTFAVETGNLLAKTFKNKLSSAVLPDGRMYYNIADRILNATLGNNYNLISEYTAQVQQALNDAAGIGIKPIIPGLNQDRIDGIVDRLASEIDYDEVAWILDDPVVNFSQSIIDDFVRDNAEFHYNAGLSSSIVRRQAGRCCKWCAAMTGTFTYPNVPRDVYRRHENCRCTVTYFPGDGGTKGQDVWSKIWR